MEEPVSRSEYDRLIRLYEKTAKELDRVDKENEKQESFELNSKYENLVRNTIPKLKIELEETESDLKAFQKSNSIRGDEMIRLKKELGEANEWIENVKKNAFLAKVQLPDSPKP